MTVGNKLGSMDGCKGGDVDDITVGERLGDVDMLWLDSYDSEVLDRILLGENDELLDEGSDMCGSIKVVMVVF